MADDANLVVAIDGPSGVGKSTVARMVAERLGVPYLDTGAMYRCLALRALREDLSEEPTEEEIEALLDGLRLDLEVEDGRARLLLDGEEVGDEIRTGEVARSTSILAACPSVRRWMVERQRQFATTAGGVVEGRDIGTVVFPETPYKFFLDADTDVRARRRWLQLCETRPDLELDEVRRDLVDRDRRDRSRSEAPLVRTPSHLLVDTSHDAAEVIAERIASFVTAS